MNRFQSPHWVLVILLLCAVAAAPLLRSESPCTHDGAFHTFRVTAMRHALQNGVFLTRYLPDLAFGYGYPFFNYRAALSYYMALALHLTGMALPLALNLVYVLSIAGSALAAYLLAGDLFGPQAGVVAAVAYAYAPYQFLDALLRGNMPETVALPLLPLILWAFRRLALTGRRRWFLVSVGSLAALLLTHNISSLLFVPFLLAYLAVLWLVYRRTAAVTWTAVGGALALAIGLTAFFWGPALLEQTSVQLHMSRVTRNNDFHYNFLPLAEILAPPAPVDTSLMNPPMRIHLGLVQAALAGMGLIVGTFRARGEQRNGGAREQRSKERWGSLVFFAVVALFFVFMSTRASLWLWEHVPLLPFVQFPWRFIGRAALPVALLAGALASLPSTPTHHAPTAAVGGLGLRFTNDVSRVACCAAVGVLLLSAFPYTYPPHGYCSSAPHPTISDVFAYEHQSKLVGVDPEGSYFPIWVKQRPEGSALEEQYAAGGPVTRFDETTLPEGASVVEADYGPNRAHVVVETPVPFRARYQAFYFPGWQVHIDGEAVEVTATDPEGLMAFDVPAGRHTVRVHFGSTPTRTAFAIVSLLSLAALITLAIGYPQPASPKPQESSSESLRVIGVSPRQRSLSASFIVVAVLLVTLKLAVVDRMKTPFRRPTLRPDGTLPGVEHRLDQSYADGLTLIGYDQEGTRVPADGVLRLDLYWTAHARPTARYQSVIHLVGPDGLRWSLPDSFRPRGYADYPPTTTWGPGRYALDSQEVEPLPGTPPGTYDVVLTTFDRDTLVPLSVLNEQGQPAAPTRTLGQVALTAPRRPVDPDRLGIRHRLDTPLGPLTLLGADFDRDQAAPGDPVLLTTFWRTDQQPTGDLSVHVSLLDPDGSPAAEYDLPPTVRWHPTSAWQPGDTWRGQHMLHLPARLDSGDHTWTVRLSHTPTHPVAHISITAPDRIFTPPPVEVEANTRLGSAATLLGANLKPGRRNLTPGTDLTVTLIWRAEATASTSYHVFLHLLDAGGVLVAQSDGVPADWSRPTTGWLPGEYVTDVHSLTIPPDVPAGDYTLCAGLYVPGGERLTTRDGSDAIPLGAITIGDKR